MDRSFIRRHSVLLLVVLTVPLTFGVALLPLPALPAQLLMVLVPAVAAIVLAALGGEKAEVRRLLSRLAQWRVNLKWLAIALAVALAMRLTMALAALLSNTIPAIQPAAPALWLFLAVVSLVAAIPEELAWRGYALPRLLTRHSPARAALVIGLPWGVLHLALHLPGLPNEGLPLLPTLLQLLGLSVLLTWLYVRGGDNVVLTTIFHAAQTTFALVTTGIPPLASHWLMAIVWVAAALPVLLDRAMWRQVPPVPVQALANPL